MRYETVKGDTAKPVEATLEDEDGAVPLLGATVKFLMMPAPQSGLSAPTVNADAVVVNPSAVEGDPDFAKVRYWPADADVAVAGIFRAQFAVTFGNGKKETFPSKGYIDVIIQSNLHD